METQIHPNFKFIFSLSLLQCPQDKKHFFSWTYYINGTDFFKFRIWKANVLWVSKVFSSFSGPLKFSPCPYDVASNLNLATQIER